jgi:hypothetical protein
MITMPQDLTEMGYHRNVCKYSQTCLKRSGKETYIHIMVKLKFISFVVVVVVVVYQNRRIISVAKIY